MQNDTNRSKPPGEGRFRSRQPQETPSRGDPRQAVRQGRTDVVTRRQTETPQPSAQRVPMPQDPPKRSHNGRPEQRQPQPGRTERAVPPGASERQRSRPSETGSVSVRPPASPTHHEERARQVVIGKPKYQKEAERKPEPVIIDSPDIEASPKAANDAEKACGTAGSVTKDERKFYLQRPRDISTLRKMLILVFGFLFLWCLAPAFFHIRGIGVFSSSAVMLGICLTAMFWHLIDRNWTFKKAAVVSLAALLFTACVAAFGIVSGMMLKASLTAVPKDCPNYTVVVLGCKAHGDQPMRRHWRHGRRRTIHRGICHEEIPGRKGHFPRQNLHGGAFRQHRRKPALYKIAHQAQRSFREHRNSFRPFSRAEGKNLGGEGWL